MDNCALHKASIHFKVSFYYARKTRVHDYHPTELPSVSYFIYDNVLSELRWIPAFSRPSLKGNSPSRNQSLEGQHLYLRKVACWRLKSVLCLRMLKTVERITELEMNFLSIISWIFSTKTVSSCQSCGWRPKNKKKQVLQSLMHGCMDLFSEDTCLQQIGCGWTWRLSDGWGLVNSRLYRETM